MTKVFIIVLNWKGKKDTLDCLKSISKLNTREIELTTIVVDNASADGSVEEISRFEVGKGKMIVIENDANLGFSGGNNVGIKYSLENDADYVLVVNNDIVLDHLSLLQLIKVFENSDKIGAVSPIIFFFKGYEYHKRRYMKSELGKVVWSAGGKIDWTNAYAQNFGVDEVDHGQFIEEETEFATGACVLYKANILKKIGMFDEKYFLYFEDTDLSMRIKKGGYKILFTPNAKVWHKVAQSSGIGSNLNDYYTTRNRMIFGMKYASMRTKIALIRESLSLFLHGRNWQRVGVRDYYLRRFYQGSWQS